MKKNLPITDIENEIHDTDFLISQTDLKGKIKYVSPDFCRISEFTSDEMVGRPHNIIRHPDIPPAMYQDMWKTIQSGKPWNGVIKNRAKSGNYYWVEALMMPIVRNNKIEGYLSVRKKVNQKERQKATAEYKKKWKQKERFSRFERFIQWTKSYNTKLGIVILAALILVSVPMIGYGSSLLNDRSCLRDFQVSNVNSCIPEIDNSEFRSNLNFVLRANPALSNSLGTERFAIEVKRFEALRSQLPEFDSWVRLAESNESEAVIRASLDKLNRQSIDIVESLAQGQLAMIQWKTMALLLLLMITLPIAIFGGFWVVARFNHRLGQVMDSVALLSGGRVQKLEADHRDWSMRKFKTIMVSLDSLTTVLSGVFFKITNAVEDSQKVSIALAQNSQLLMQLSERLASTSKESSSTVDEFHSQIQAITESVRHHSQKMSV
ncbi:MAG: PAS domain-containing protein [Leptonema sp. (in: Bacteria)]|nr:PAS domain-containing protein [Leptonema sp. (in: bacteria)]